MLVASVVLKGQVDIKTTFYRNLIQVLPFITIFLIIFFAPLNPQALSPFIGHPSVFAFIICISVGLTLFFGLPKIIYNNTLGRGLIRVGDFSYSLYLVHFPVIVLYNYEPFSGTSLGFNNLSDLFFILLITSIFTYLSYNFIERGNFFQINILKRLTIMVASLFIVIFVVKNLTKDLYDKDSVIFDALEDRDQYRCGVSFRVFNPLHSVCFLDNINKSKNILLLGDSHADSIKQVFKTEAIKENIGTLFTSANAPLFGSHFPLSNLLKALEGKSVDAIVIHYSNVYNDGTKKDNLHEALKVFKSLNMKVFLIAPIPTYKVNVPKVIYENRGATIDSSFLSRSSYELSLLAFKDFIKESEIDSSKIFYPGNFLCSESECLIEDIKGIPLYFDKSHLTISGSKRLRPIFNEIIADVSKH